MLEKLAAAVRSHGGEFHCVELGNTLNKKIVRFRHVVEDPAAVSVPTVGGLEEFYATFGALTLYHDQDSDEAAFYIAAPDLWHELDGYFKVWHEDMDETEREEYLPEWIDDYIVIGELPNTGNFLLMPLSGDSKGKVFEFEHDGFEFIEHADTLPAFVESRLDLDNAELLAMASHRRFVTPPSNA